MLRLCTFVFGVFFTLALPVAVQAQSLSEEEVKELALEAILENPEIIMQAVDILQKREQEAQAQAAAGLIGALDQDPNAPILGNPDGQVVLVEFFDYNCPYCRRAGEALQQIIADNPDVKVVFREWPVLGEGSVFAARAALAARNQDQYEAFHWAIMNDQGRATEATIMRTARDLGLDVDQLRADMESDIISEHLATSTQLAQALGFTGTPAFVIGDQLAPGAIPAEQMQQMVDQARDG